MKKSTVQTLVVLAVVAMIGISAAIAGVDPVPAVTPVTVAPDSSIWSILINNKGVILAALLAVSEALALIPGIKANSIFELVVNALKLATGNNANTPEIRG